MNDSEDHTDPSAYGLSEAQKTLYDAGMDPTVIKYPNELNTFGIIKVLMDENKALIATVRELVRQRNLAIEQMPHSCMTCVFRTGHAADDKCYTCAQGNTNWKWNGFERSNSRNEGE